MPASSEPASVALQVLSSLASSIPPSKLAQARGLLITRTHRAALGFGFQTGTAVALRRVDGLFLSTSLTSTSSPSASSGPTASCPSSSCNWSAPLVFAVRRASFGVSYGYATVDSVLLLKSDEEVRLLAAGGAPAFGTEHRFVSSVLDDNDGEEDEVEVEVEGRVLDKEELREERKAAAAAAIAGGGGGGEAARGGAAAARGGAATASGAAAMASAATTTASPYPTAPASPRSALLFSRSSGALVDMSVVAGMLSLDAAAHAALYGSSSSSSNSPSRPIEPEDVLEGKVARPEAFASVYELLDKMECGQGLGGRGRGG